MTKLIVTSIDMSQPGSHWERLELMEIMEQVKKASPDDFISVTVQAYRQLEKLIRPRVHTDDDTPIEEAWRQISANDFDNLVGAILGREPTVPPANASSSSAGLLDTIPAPAG